MLDRHEDTLAILVQNIGVSMHHHHAIQLVISLDNPYQAIIDRKEIGSTRGFLIDAEIPHACQSSNSTVLVISVDASTAKGRALKQHLSHRTFALIDEIFTPEAIDRFSSDYWHHYRNPDSKFDFLSFIHILYDGKNEVIPFDERLLTAIEFISQNIGKPIQVAAIASHVGLSESRLRHLFAEQLGISIASYILWIRIKVALREMLKPGVTLSSAAHLANFSDHAHFTRTFKRMFGVAPSLLLEHGQFIQVFGL